MAQRRLMDLGGAIKQSPLAVEIADCAMQLHRAVGNLYRQRGLLDRATEVHEAALRHPDLKLTDRLDLMADLGRDYQAAGLLDRAQAVLEEILTHGPDQPVAHQARSMLLQLAQTQRDWQQAIYWAQQVRAQSGSVEGHTLDQLLGLSLIHI